MQGGYTKLYPWRYLGGQKYTLTGDQFVTLPSECDIVQIRAVSGAVSWAVGPAGTLATNGPGYIPEDGAEIIGPLSNWENTPNKQGLALYAASATAYVVFFQEVKQKGARLS